MDTIFQPAKDDITLQFHFNHCCNCAKFGVKYFITDCNGEEGPQKNFGSINLNGCGDIYDPKIKTIIKKGQCFSKVTFKFKCESASGCYGGSDCHEGAAGEFKQNGVVIANISVLTSQDSEISYCSIINNAP